LRIPPYFGVCDAAAVTGAIPEDAVVVVETGFWVGAGVVVAMGEHDAASKRASNSRQLRTVDAHFLFTVPPPKCNFADTGPARLARTRGTDTAVL